ncbi:MAG: transposase [Kiritimatiellae bacterium]|nr:transposase [Kiritimatiellia bacterium]
MNRSHQIRLYPNKEQRIMLAKTAGTVRYCYNWGLSKWDEMHKNGEKCDQYLLSRLWTQERPEWSKEVFRGAQTRALLNLGGAFSAFFKGMRRHPGFHKKGRKDSFYVTNDKPRLRGDHKISLPNIGVVNMAEKLRFDGKILGYTVSKQADRWYVSIQVELAESTCVAENESAVGIDVGSKHWAVSSDGDVLDRPKSIPKLEKRLKRAQRSLSRKRKDSRNRDKARMRVARLHQRIRNVKRDAVHKFTTTIAKNHGVVCCENLCVNGMGKSVKSIRKAVRNSCMSGLRMMLAYKAAHYVEIDRFYPSSKRCSRCGNVKAELGLSERTYRCEACGNVLDRDLNAALNIRDEGFRIFTEGHSGSACGGR